MREREGDKKGKERKSTKEWREKEWEVRERRER